MWRRGAATGAAAARGAAGHGRSGFVARLGDCQRRAAGLIPSQGQRGTRDMTTIHTTSEQRAAIQAADDGKPIAIVNLLKFHDQAQYPAGSAEAAEGLTGRDAYRRYVAGWVALIAEFGGEQVYWGDTV